MKEELKLPNNIISILGEEMFGFPPCIGSSRRALTVKAIMVNQRFLGVIRYMDMYIYVWHAVNADSKIKNTKPTFNNEL